MASFRALLRDARREGIALRIFISPVHARYLEWYRRVGWWPLFEAWKRELVATIDAEGEPVRGRPAAVLWDFSGFHPPAMEVVPRLGDLAARMRWYRDTSHYSPALGDLVLDRILARAGTELPSWPATPMSAATIDGNLALIRAGAAEYARQEPGETANVDQMLRYLRRVARK
jgi:hypothetical protein